MSNDIESLRVRATELGLKFSGNTGAETLKKKIEGHSASFLVGVDEPLPEIIKPKKPKAPPSLAELQMMNLEDIDPDDQVLMRLAVRARALVLRRIKIVNLDPGDAELHGAVITVMNKYTGKVSKFVPFGDDAGNGYHVPQIILNYLLEQKFVMRKQNKGGQFGVKTYKTSLIPKFAIEILPDLTKDEMKSLSDRQTAAQSIQQE